jgi:hypothetical protein
MMIDTNNIDRRPASVLAACAARKPVYTLNPQRGWVLCDDGVYARIPRTNPMYLNLYGVKK